MNLSAQNSGIEEPSDDFIDVPGQAALMVPIKAFDEIHVISDLHLGGRPGFQIFGLRQELIGLLHFLAQRPAHLSVALVINGDFIDFLAEEPANYFDPIGAAGKLTQILQATFPEIQKALQTFVGTPNRVLLVNVGNHDMELALPWVRERLYELLSANDPVARSRMAVSTEGSGIRCGVGAAEVLCVHGNEVDDWNVTDHERIRRIGRDLVQGRGVEPWIPNAGTRMVIDVMNEVKRKYPFVDLLKPEVAAVIPTLLALEPGMVSRFTGALPVVGRRVIDRVRMTTGLLEAERAAGGPSGPGGSASASEAAVVSRPRSDSDRQALATALLDRAEARLTAGEMALDLVGQEASGEFLGLGGAMWNLAKGDAVESLRAALEGLQKDRSFNIGDPDATFAALDAVVGPDVDFLVAGHTHLERALPRRSGRGFYYNSGTWARLIKLERAVLQDPDRFARAFAAFKAGQMEALDQEPELVMKRPTFVSVWTEGARTYAELRRFDATATPPFTPVDQSRFPSA